MAWFYLLMAGIFEIGWPVGLKFAQTSRYRIPAVVFSVICLAASGWLLWLAQKSIPMGTAYAVWTGIGAAGTFIVGIIFFNDPQSFVRWLGAVLIVSGVAVLKMSQGSAR
ncbi:MAG: QacE family quaternary ammonium compound efflux SMR transporter [Proteobacteria bacterium]|nr:QacE family quaternary ammonium compound efflux SMR transporter [Pseudomonadota bacterium]